MTDAPFAGTARFEVRKEVGSGGFGTVYQAWDNEHQQLVALKHLHRSDPVTLRRFKQEFRSLANLTHAHMVSLYELHQQEADWFFTMEFVEGATFADWLRPSSPLPPAALTSSLALTRPLGRFRSPTVAEKWRTAPTADPDLPAASTTAAPVSRLSPGDLHAQPLVAPPALDSTRLTPASSSPSRLPRDDHGTPPPPPLSAATPGSQLALAQPFYGIEIPDEATRAHWEGTRPGFGLLPPDPARVRPAFRQLVEALAWLHASGHLHRDVKPSNVLVNTGGVVKVLDFGLVTRLFASDVAPGEALLGTPAYMAPELCAGLAASPASDWYSVGVMLYLVLTGALPFWGDLSALILAKQAIAVRPPSELTEVPRDLEDICLALLAVNPVERPDAAWLLHALGDTRHHVPRFAHDADASFVGRQAELAALDDVVGGARPGTSIALVEGLSGVGKSTLVERVLATAEARDGTLVLRSRCFERGSVRYRALDGAVDDLARWLARLPDSFDAAIHAIDAADRSALMRVFPALPASDAGDAHDDDPDLRAEPTELRRRAFAALRELIRATARLVAARRPEAAHLRAPAPAVVMAIDDAQWADEDSLGPLVELMRTLPPDEVRWVLAYRYDDKERSPFLRAFAASVAAAPLNDRARVIALGPLAPGEALALARDSLAGAGADDAHIAAVAAESEGNPLVIAELSRLLATTTGADTPHATRAALADLLAARVLELPDAARAALELIAVAGEPIPARLIRAATGADQRDLNRLVNEHLVAAHPSAAGEVVMAWHDRVRETVAARLPPAARARRHEALAATAAAQGGADDLFLHIHWREAGVVDKARIHGLAAADQAMRAFAFDRAAELYRAVIAASPAGAEPAHHEALGDALTNAGRGVEAAKAYLQGAAVASSPVETRRLEIRAAEQYLFAGAFGEGESVIRKVLERIGHSLPDSAPMALAAFAWETLRNRLRGPDFVRRDAAAIPSAELALTDTLWSVTIGLSMALPLASQAFQQRHLRAALDAGEPLRVARALSIELAFSGLPGGNDERKSHALSRRTHAVARSIAHPYAEAFATMSDGATHWLRGRWPEARQAMETALAVYDRHCTGVYWEKDTARFVWLSTLAHSGDFAELRPRYAAALDDALERGDLYLETQLRTRFGPLLDLLDDRPADARAGIHRALARWTAAGFQVVHYWGLINRVLSFVYEGDGPSAWRELLAGTGPLKRSLMLMGQYYRVQYHALIATAALAALPHASSGREAKVLRVRARDAARRLIKEDMGWSRPHGALVEALLEGSRSTERPSIGLEPRDAAFVEAARGFDRVAMHAHRIATEIMRAEAAADRAAVEASQAELAGRGAAAPERFRRLYSGV